MTEYFSEKHFNLQLFAGDGAGAAGDGTGAEGATGVEAGVPDPKASKNPLANVKYGKQATETKAEETDATSSQPTVADRNAEFEKLIKGEYKDLYDARVQSTVQQRLKASKDVEAKYNELTPMMEMLAKKYGVDAKDAKALAKAIEDDDAYYEDEALERGMSVQELKNVRKMERENEALKAQIAQRENQAKAEQDVARWMAEAKEAQAMFPGLDLNAEIQNPQFARLLQSGIDVSTAYFAVHNKELVPQAMQYTAKQTEQRVVNRIRAQGKVPSENATGATATAIVKNDVSAFTKEDREEIARRVARGERIVL